MGSPGERIPSGCAIFGVMSEKGRRFSGTDAIKGITNMHERSNGLGGGFAAYGIYPEFRDHYTFHVMSNSQEGHEEMVAGIRRHFRVVAEEPIPTRRHPRIGQAPVLWRYFVTVPEGTELPDGEEEYIVSRVMELNGRADGSLIFSSGKNMGVFKGVGYPEDIGEFFRLEEYEGYLWTVHGRFPTNTPGWWGGAHPFGLLNWSVVHNGEISSFDANRRYLEMFGYRCYQMTDTEVIVYLFDLLHRRHGLPIDVSCAVMAAPFWSEIDRMDPDNAVIWRTIRQVYAGALLNGPFSVIVGFPGGMVGLADRIMLRPLVGARKDDRVFIASEESAIRSVCPDPEVIWTAEGGEPVIARLRGSGEAGAAKGAARAKEEEVHERRQAG